MSSVTCSFCDKSFANKYSLSSHISRYHRENRESDESSTILQPPSKANSDAADVKLDSSDSVHSDADTIVSEESQQGGSNSDVSGSDDEEYSDVTSSDDDSSKEYSTDELESDTVWQHRGKRKGVPIKQSINKKIKISKQLKSIEVLLQSISCKEQDKCFDNLSSYMIKTHVFVELKQHFIDCGRDLTDDLSFEEQALLDAVITTPSLSDVNKLMNENLNMVKKILKTLSELEVGGNNYKY